MQDLGNRRDLLLAYVALNVGVLAVTTLLTGAKAGIGLGLGRFGILSIIRLCSDQIAQPAAVRADRVDLQPGPALVRDAAGPSRW